MTLGLVTSFLLTGCQSLNAASSVPPALETPTTVIQGQVFQEVAPPPVIQALAPSFAQYAPTVEIISPQAEQVIKKTKICVKLNVSDFPVVDPEASLRPHIHLIVDNEPYRAIYNVDEPIILEDLEPGTHTLRAFPVRPWHESYKNVGAYAQTTFHVLTKTNSNNPDVDQPLLTYSRPKGDYGAEPILLDFYLQGAPLHFAALAEPELNDWRIRVTINDESFLLNQWQPIYLKGFQEGENWVKLEFIDEAGNLVANRYNNTVRVINVQPGGTDALSELMTGQLSLADAFALVGLEVPSTVDAEELGTGPEAEIPTAPDSLPPDPSTSELPPVSETSPEEIEIAPEAVEELEIVEELSEQKPVEELEVVEEIPEQEPAETEEIIELDTDTETVLIEITLETEVETPLPVLPGESIEEVDPEAVMTEPVAPAAPDEELSVESVEPVVTP